MSGADGSMHEMPSNVPYGDEGETATERRIAGAIPRSVVALAAAVGVVELVFASRYGYHRDELYFLAAGRHLDWSYADQGPLTPLIARGMSAIASGSLTVLRIPSALAAAAIVVVTAALAREFGGSPRAQTIAAGCAAVSSIVLFDGHLLSTSTIDLLVWTVLTWLVVRAVSTGEDWLWLVAGFVLGVGLLNKPLPAFLAVALLAGLVLTGPRRLLRSRYFWAGAGIAVLMWMPWLVWQARHGWPQFEVSRAIASGGSASSQPWWAVVPFQFLLVSPVLAPVWVSGLVMLFRAPALRPYRFLGWTWVLLAGAFMATGGKPYYLAGLLPALLAAGSPAVDSWLAREHRSARRGVLVAAVALSALIDATIALPVLPADKAGPVIAVNADVGETIGWQDLVHTVADVRRGIPHGERAVILTSNYGEAGAVDRYGPALGLPRAYSGHNAYSEWGPPRDDDAPVIAVGSRLARYLTGCRIAAHIHNAAHVHNDERGVAVLVCAGPRQAWQREWPSLRRYG